MSTQIPGGNPSDLEDFAGMFRHIFGKQMQAIDDMLPAKVISYNRTTNLAKVQPLIKMVTADGNTVSRATIAEIPVFQYAGGGFMVSFPIAAGDLGWIKANDRDISLYMASFNESAPNTLRRKSFSDAMFFPDIMRGYSIAAEDAGNLVIQYKDTTTKIAMSGAKIKIASPTIELSATTIDLNAATVNITATTTNISGNVAITGSTLTHNGVNIGSTHIHSQGPDSAGNTEQDTGVPH